MCWLIGLLEGIPFACQLSASSQSTPCQAPIGSGCPTGCGGGPMAGSSRHVPPQCWSGWAGRWGPLMPHKVQIYLSPGSAFLARPLTSGWPFVSLSILSHPWVSPFSSFLVSFLCYTGVVVASWQPSVSPACPGHTLQVDEWIICGTKIADFVCSISELLLEKLGCLQNFVSLKQEAKRRLWRSFYFVLGSGTLNGLVCYTDACTQTQRP